MLHKSNCVCKNKVSIWTLTKTYWPSSHSNIMYREVMKNTCLDHISLRRMCMFRSLGRGDKSHYQISLAMAYLWKNKKIKQKNPTLGFPHTQSLNFWTADVVETLCFMCHVHKPIQHSYKRIHHIYKLLELDIFSVHHNTTEHNGQPGHFMPLR